LSIDLDVRQLKQKFNPAWNREGTLSPELKVMQRLEEIPFKEPLESQQEFGGEAHYYNRRYSTLARYFSDVTNLKFQTNSFKWLS
jgi:hypothetical protein